MQEVCEKNQDVTITPLGEAAVLVSFGDTIDPAIHNKVHAFANSLAKKPFDGMTEYTEAFSSVAVYYDMVRLQAQAKLHHFTTAKLPLAYQAAVECIRDILAQVDFSVTEKSRRVRIPVCYGGEFGPDLEEVAAQHNISAADVVRIHTGGKYLVYMIGFAPGFPYIGGLPESIATPRRSSPRLAIPAGSVGIAGGQTGVYPIETPGGWQLIGKTPVPLFQPECTKSPSLLQAGDAIEFYAISAEEYEAYAKEK